MGRPRAKVKRGFGEVGQLPSGRYRARYTGPDGGRHSAPITFVARIDAEGWLVDQERMISRGEWEPPARQVREVHEAPLLLGEYAATVVARLRIRPGTAALYAKLLRLTILPAFAKRPLGEMTAAEVSTWYAGMRGTPTQQANAYGLLKSIFKEAVEERPRGGEPMPGEGGHPEGTRTRDRGAHGRPAQPLPGCRARGAAGSAVAGRMVRSAFRRGARAPRARLGSGHRCGACPSGRRATQGATPDRPTQDGCRGQVGVHPSTHLLPALREWAVLTLPED